MLPTHGNLLTFLQGQLLESGTGPGRTVLVSGDPGSGKTTALRTFVDHAGKNTDALVLSGTGTPDEQPLRAGILEQLISNSGIPEDTRQEIGRVISSVDGDDIRFIHEAGAALLDIARERPVVIAVDDVHLADDWSVRLLCHLHRRIGSSRLLVVLTRWTRVDAAPSPHADLAELTCLRIRLDPACAEGVAVDDQETPIDALHAALRRWGQPMAETSRAIAILAEHADTESVVRFVGGPTSVVEDMIGALTRADLVLDGRFREPHVAGAVLAELSADELTGLHRRAATVVYERGRGALVAARHLVAVGQAEAGWSLEILREAAEQAAASDDAGFAARCLELAAVTVTEEREQLRIRAALARAIWRSDPEIASRNVRPLRDAVRSSSSTPVDDASILVRDALWRGDRESLSAALNQLTCADPQARAEIRLACLWHFGPKDFVPEPADSTDSPWPHVTEMLADGWLSGAGGKAATSAELILRSRRLADLSLEALAIALCTLPDAERAERWCARLIAEAADRGAVTWQALLGAVHAMLRLRSGDPAGAADEAAAALGLLSTEGWGAAIGFPLSVLVLAHTKAGNHAAAADALRVPVPAAMFGTLNGSRYLHARGCHHLAVNRVLAAVGDLQRCQHTADEEWGDGSRPAALVPWRRDLAEAMARLSEQIEGTRIAAPAKSWTTRLTVQVARAYEHTTPRLMSRVREDTAVSAKAGEDAAELSEAELRVAELAAAGRSNREISGDLYVTISTVEQHLTRVYKKLGVAGRSGLAARLDPAAR